MNGPCRLPATLLVMLLAACGADSNLPSTNVQDADNSTDASQGRDDPSPTDPGLGDSSLTNQPPDLVVDIGDPPDAETDLPSDVRAEGIDAGDAEALSAEPDTDTRAEDGADAEDATDELNPSDTLVSDGDLGGAFDPDAPRDPSLDTPPDSLTDRHSDEDVLEDGSVPTDPQTDTSDSSDLLSETDVFDSQTGADPDVSTNLELVPSDPCETDEWTRMGQPTDPDNPHFRDVSTQVGHIGLEGLDVVFGGLSVADFDSDGDVDIVYTGNNGRLSVRVNCGNGFLRPSDGIFSGSQVLGVRVLTHGDIDNDGDPDLYAGSHRRAYLLENRGDWQFADVTTAWGIGWNPGRGGATFADFDDDGRIDLYESGYESRLNRLRRNTGERFVELTTTPGNSPDQGSSLGTAWVDVNDDGRIDLFLVNDFGFLYGPNGLFLNRGPDPDDDNNWLFQDVSQQAGFDVPILGMGAAFGDVDNDGDFDAYAANITNNVLHILEDTDSGLCPEGNTVGFCGVDRAQALGVSSGHRVIADNPATWRTYNPLSSDPWESALHPFCEAYCDEQTNGWALVSWSPIFFDADHNGWQDLFISNGNVPFNYMPIGLLEPNYLYMNDAMSFSELPDFPTTFASSRGSAVGDLDEDGDLDLLWIDNGWRGQGGLRILENRLAVGNWLQVGLQGVTSNRDAIGAKLTLVAGTTTLTRHIDGGSGFASSSERIAHFGLAAIEEIESLTVLWPSGITQTLEDVDVNQRLLLLEPVAE